MQVIRFRTALPTIISWTLRNPCHSILKKEEEEENNTMTMLK